MVNMSNLTVYHIKDLWKNAGSAKSSSMQNSMKLYVHVKYQYLHSEKH